MSCNHCEDMANQLRDLAKWIGERSEAIQRGESHVVADRLKLAAEAFEALRLLVEAKDLKDNAPNGNWSATRYHKLKNEAWSKARAVLAKLNVEVKP